MAVKAIAKGVRISPRKAGEVVALVRGRSVADALVILEHTPRRGASAVKSVIASARANAEHNHGYKPDTLVIAEISVNSGSSLKRYRPIARGRAAPYLKRTSHISVIVDGQKRTVKSVTKKTAEKETK